MSAGATGVYESGRMLSDYLLFHYGREEDQLPWPFGPREALHFPVRCAGLCRRAAGGGAGRVLDLGCAVGRGAFEMARFAREVVGVDYSWRFIDAARALQQSGRLDFHMIEEGERTVSRAAVVPEDIDRSRVAFIQGDACHPPEGLGVFDGALLANLLCRLPGPAACLEHLAGMIRPGGWVVTTTPASWSEEYTPRDKWLGGRADGFAETREGVAARLGKDFRLESREDMPFLLREHRRKFQWTVAEAGVWRKTG